MFTTLVIVGLLAIAVWAVNRLVPMAPPVRTIVNLVSIILIVWWMLTRFGVV